MNKYADVAIPESVRLIEDLGGCRSSLIAKIAGGACMFDLSRDGGPDIGRRNVEATKAMLEVLNIPLTAEDIGGERGRSVEFHLDTGELRVRTVRGGERII